MASRKFSAGAPKREERLDPRAMAASMEEADVQFVSRGNCTAQSPPAQSLGSVNLQDGRPQNLGFGCQLCKIGELPRGTVAQQTLNNGSMHRVPCTLSHNTPPDPAAR